MKKTFPIITILITVSLLGLIFFQGAFVAILVLIGFLLFEPKYILFTIVSSTLFFFTRAMFMVLTHLSAPSVAYYSYVTREHHVDETLFTISSGNDLFFSGHAGYPLLLALIFWQWRYARYFFLLCSIVGSVAVILGHLHYSIDVSSAYFIAFGVFELSRKLFVKEYQFIA